MVYIKAAVSVFSGSSSVSLIYRTGFLFLLDLCSLDQMVVQSLGSRIGPWSSVLHQPWYNSQFWPLVTVLFNLSTTSLSCATAYMFVTLYIQYDVKKKKEAANICHVENAAIRLACWCTGLCLKCRNNNNVTKFASLRIRIKWIRFNTVYRDWVNACCEES